ncbi:hypothetical protein GCM10010441_17790 [Kitasatospora paracochleata]
MHEGESAIIWTVTSMTPSEPVVAESNRIKVWFRFVPREVPDAVGDLGRAAAENIIALIRGSSAGRRGRDGLSADSR